MFTIFPVATFMNKSAVGAELKLAGISGNEIITYLDNRRKLRISCFFFTIEYNTSTNDF